MKGSLIFNTSGHIKSPETAVATKEAKLPKSNILDILLYLLWGNIPLSALQNPGVFHLCLYQGLAITFHRVTPTTLKGLFTCSVIHSKRLDNFLCAKNCNKPWKYKNFGQK